MKKIDPDLRWIEDYKAAGDLNALGELYRPYMTMVYGVALKYLKDTDKSKDMVMEVFELLVQKLKSHKISNFRSWLYVLCRNQCLMQIRNDKKIPLTNLDDSFMESEPFLHHDEDGNRESSLQAMEKCIEQLNDDQRQSVELFYLRQKCYAEIADLTGNDLKKIKSFIQNGKRNLKLCVEKQLG